MKSASRVALWLTLFLMAFAFVKSGSGQTNSTRGVNYDPARQAFAIELIRTINTAELDHKQELGSYATWPDLLAANPEFFRKFLSTHDLPGPNAVFSKTPDILPGWNLRLNVHSDGQGYDVLLEDKTDKKSGYAALSDERGGIRESKWIR